MRKSVNVINSGEILIDKDKLYNDNLKYVKLYSKRCFELYDLGYISTPSVFIEDEFLLALYEEFPKCIHYLTSGFNKVLIKESLFFDYIMKLTDNEELNEILKKYRDILECISAFNAYTELNKRVHFKKNTNVAPVKSLLVAITSVKNTSVIPLDSPYIQDVFYLSPEYKLVECDVSELWLKFICEEIDIPLSEFYRCKDLNKSLFSDKLSFEDDLKYIRYILTGDIITESENTKKLHNYLENFYINYGDKNKDYSNFEEKIFLERKDEFNEYVEDFKIDVYMRGGSEYYITNTKVIFQVPLSEEDYTFSNTDSMVTIGVPLKRIDNSTEPYIGRFLFDNLNNRNLSVSCVLSGLSGEFIDEAYINTRDYEINGLPVVIKEFRPKGTPVYHRYYPIFNLRHKDSNEVYPTLGYNHGVFNVDEQKLLNFFEISSLSDIKETLEPVLDQVINNKTNINTISKCISALLTLNCGHDITDISFLDEINDSNADDILFNVDKYYNIILNNSNARVTV